MCIRDSYLSERIGQLQNLKLLWAEDQRWPRRLGYQQRLCVWPEGLNTINWLLQVSICNCDLRHLPDSLGQLWNLEGLILNHNVLEKLPTSLGQLWSLKYLRLGWNLLTHLPESVGKLWKLEDLDLQNNGLTDLPNSMASLWGLQNCNVVGNPIDRESWIDTPPHRDVYRKCGPMQLPPYCGPYSPV